MHGMCNLTSLTKSSLECVLPDSCELLSHLPAQFKELEITHGNRYAKETLPVETQFDHHSQSSQPMSQTFEALPQ
jgi:hypothetical protein